MDLKDVRQVSRPSPEGGAEGRHWGLQKDMGSQFPWQLFPSPVQSWQLCM